MAHVPLISIAELASALTSAAPPVVFDCRFDIARPDWGREEHGRAHIAGAQFADIHHDLASPVTATSGRHPLPDVATFTAWLGAHGVTASTPVVAYDQGSGAFAARLWWLLRSLGHANVRVLDGGLAAWNRVGHPVTTDVTVPSPATYVPASPVFTSWVMADEVGRSVANAGVLVDARAADRFAGQNETIDPIAGHVPGAINRPFASNIGPDGMFLPAETLRAQWTELLGGRGASSAIMMCGSGVTACHNLLSLAHAGLSGARLYAGSWSEWIRDPARGVAMGA